MVLLLYLYSFSCQEKWEQSIKDTCFQCWFRYKLQKIMIVALAIKIVNTRQFLHHHFCNSCFWNLFFPFYYWCKYYCQVYVDFHRLAFRTFFLLDDGFLILSSNRFGWELCNWYGFCVKKISFFRSFEWFELGRWTMDPT